MNKTNSNGKKKETWEEKKRKNDKMSYRKISNI